MRTYAQEQKPPVQKAAAVTKSSKVASNIREVQPSSPSQRCVGQHAASRPPNENAKHIGTASNPHSTARFNHDFSQMPVEPNSTSKTPPKPSPRAAGNLFRARQALSSAGEALGASTRRPFETHWGQDFSRVRIHTDHAATSSARELGAAAYTVGRHIVFDARFYQPQSHVGKHILAHELAHSVADRMAEPATTLRLGATTAAEESAARHTANTLAAPRASSDVADTIRRMTRQEALTYAQSLETRYPNWLGVIPDCPCTFDAARNSSDFVYSAVNDLVLGFFHPGAKSSVRSSRGYQTTSGTSHGQQCCYDDFGDLITDGPGAGTPDVWSPETNFSEHQSWDVDTFNALGWQVYNQYWRPNRGTNCERNAALITRPRSVNRTDPIDRTVTTQSGVAWAQHANGNSYLVQIRIQNSSTSRGRTRINFLQFVDSELRQATLDRARRLQPRGVQTIPWNVISAIPDDPPSNAIRQ